MAFFINLNFTSSGNESVSVPPLYVCEYLHEFSSPVLLATTMLPFKFLLE